MARMGVAGAPFDFAARLEAACQILADTGFPLKGVAQGRGSGTVAAVRRAFMQGVGVSPWQYRNIFRTCNFDSMPGATPVYRRSGRGRPTLPPAVCQSTPTCAPTETAFAGNLPG